MPCGAGRYTLAAEHGHESAAYFLARLAEREQLEGFELIDFDQLDADALEAVNGRLPSRFASFALPPLRPPPAIAKTAIGPLRAVEQIIDSVRIEGGLDVQTTIRAGTDVAVHTATHVGGHMCLSEAAWSTIENGIDLAKGDVSAAVAATNVGKSSLKAAALGGLMAATLALTIAACPPAAVALHGGAHTLMALCTLANAWRATGVLKRLCKRPKNLVAIDIQRAARGFVARREAARRRLAAQTIGRAGRRFAQQARAAKANGRARARPGAATQWLEAGGSAVGATRTDGSDQCASAALRSTVTPSAALEWVADLGLTHPLVG